MLVFMCVFVSASEFSLLSMEYSCSLYEGRKEDCFRELVTNEEEEEEFTKELSELVSESVFSECFSVCSAQGNISLLTNCTGIIRNARKSESFHWNEVRGTTPNNALSGGRSIMSVCTSIVAPHTARKKESCKRPSQKLSSA